MPRRKDRDEGFSLIELMISMSVFSLLMAIIMSAFIMSMNQAKDAVARADTADEMRLAVAQLDSQIRSGSVIKDPSAESVSAAGVPAGYSVRILTSRGGIETCAQWRVEFDADGTGNLEFRSWPAWVPDDTSGWTQVATGLIAPRTPFSAADATTYAPFSMDDASGTDSVMKSLKITLRVRTEGTDDMGKAALITTTVTGRNTIFGSGGLECAHVPTP